jgi:hypothetical protein
MRVPAYSPVRPIVIESMMLILVLEVVCEAHAWRYGVCICTRSCFFARVSSGFVREGSVSNQAIDQEESTSKCSELSLLTAVVSIKHMRSLLETCTYRNVYILVPHINLD